MCIDKWKIFILKKEISVICKINTYIYIYIYHLTNYLKIKQNIYISQVILIALEARGANPF